MAYTIVLDAGHGGSDPGATYNGRQEKDDSLKLTMEVGRILSNNGYNVIYTRTTDEYNTPFEKATIGNNENGDLFVSIHRNSAPMADMFKGIQSLVYKDEGIKANLARNINRNLVELGFDDQGVIERPNLVVLKRTKMPAVLVEAGFINSGVDNMIFDNQFNAVAEAIARGIIDTVGPASNYSSMSLNNANGNQITDNQVNRNQMNGNQINGNLMDNMGMDEENSDDIGFENENNMSDMNGMRGIYVIQAGAFRNRLLAENLARRLINSGFPAMVVNEKGLFKVWIGEYQNLDNAASVERQIKGLGYDAFIRVLDTMGN